MRNRIAALRHRKGVSRRQLADALSVHYQTIGYLERELASPSLFHALQIAKYFDVPIADVFYMSEPADTGAAQLAE